MERGEYERMAAVEERGWWYLGLHANLIRAWRRIARGPGSVAVLDAGCGTGGFLAQLEHRVSDARCYGLDIDLLAATLARQKSRSAIALGSATALPFAANSFDAVFSADVLCHRGVEPSPTLQAIRYCLKPGGILVLNLPAYRWLLSGHDHAVDNVRRFGRAEIRWLLEDAGFADIRMRYWNSLLFPLMLLQRLSHRQGASDVALLPPPIEFLFRAIVGFETWLGDRGFCFPFGGSILATAVKS